MYTKEDKLNKKRTWVTGVFAQSEPAKFVCTNTIIIIDFNTYKIVMRKFGFNDICPLKSY